MKPWIGRSIVSCTIGFLAGLYLQSYKEIIGAVAPEIAACIAIVGGSGLMLIPDKFFSFWGKQ